jgi:hypothetical protein
VSAQEHEMLRFIASEAVPDILRELCETPELGLGKALDSWAEPSRVPYLTERFLRMNLVAAPEMQISTRGRACDCGVAVIEGSNVVDVIDRLREIDPMSNRISLVREGMTSMFIRLVQRLDSILRVMICSPWVSLGRDRLHAFASGIERSRRQRGFMPEVTVVTRPTDDQPNGVANETLAYFRQMGAVVSYRPNLHSKLYIIESATKPPQRYAFVGSENFTKVRYQEVGIRVSNDNQVIDDLMRYFLSLVE